MTSAGAKPDQGCLDAIGESKLGEEAMITKRRRPVARIITQGPLALLEVRKAVRELQALRLEMAQRRGFRPLTNKEIKDAIAEGRP